MKKILTVAIPTYNRSKQLELRLNELLPQLTPEVVIRVFDNGSKDQTAEIVRKYESQAVHLTRSEFNAGGPRNVTRCIEESETEWVWLMGDDDFIKPDAVEIVLKAIKNTTSNAIQFSWTSREFSNETSFASLDDLYNNHNVQELYCISALAFRREALTHLFMQLNLACLTYFPQTILILKMLDKGDGALLVHPGRIFTVAGGAKRWSTLDVARGLSLLPEFINDSKIRKTVASEVLMDVLWMLVFGLREVHNKKTAFEWKTNVKRVISIPKIYGARRFFLGTKRRRPNKKELKNYYLNLFCLYSPSIVAVLLGRHLRNKHDGGISSVESEF